MARPGREFAVAHRPELPAERLLNDRDAEFLKYPLRQIDQPPAYHAMDRRDRTTFDHAGKCSAVAVVELGWLPRRLAVQETITRWRWPKRAARATPIWVPDLGTKPSVIWCGHAKPPWRICARSASNCNPFSYATADWPAGVHQRPRPQTGGRQL